MTNGVENLIVLIGNLCIFLGENACSYPLSVLIGLFFIELSEFCIILYTVP